MFAAWLLLNGLASDDFLSLSGGHTEKLRSRAVTPGSFLLQATDGNLFTELFSDEGSRFSKYYYINRFLKDYRRTLAQKLPSDYHVADTWENYDRLAPVITQAFEHWKDRLWWRLW